VKIINMADAEEPQRVNSKPKGRTAEKVHPAQIFAEDMCEEWSKDAIKAARDAFALTIASGDVHSTIADYIRKKFDRDHERGWNCVVGRSFGCFCTHEIKTYMYFTVQPGTYVLLWRS
jgi:dynein light chain LC8-type